MRAALEHAQIYPHPSVSSDCVAYRAVAVRCTVRCTVIQYGTVRTFFTVFLKIGTVYTVRIRYGVRYGAELALPVQKWPQNGLFAPKPPIFAPRCAPPMC
jgi:hypothetical protein